jgi:hypothetical protein
MKISHIGKAAPAEEASSIKTLVSSEVKRETNQDEPRSEGIRAVVSGFEGECEVVNDHSKKQ